MWEEIRPVLIWPLSPWWDEAQTIFCFFFPAQFSFFWAVALKRLLSETISHQHQSTFKVSTSLPIFTCPPPPSLFLAYNLSLSWSSVVPTQEWMAQRKKLMKSSFPLKCRSWASFLSYQVLYLSVSEQEISLNWPSILGLTCFGANLQTRRSVLSPFITYCPQEINK